MTFATENDQGEMTPPVPKNQERQANNENDDSYNSLKGDLSNIP